MKDEIKNKMDEHIKHLLDKPSITNEDYALLEAHAAKLPSHRNGLDPFLMLMMLMIFSIGGHNHE